MGDNPHQALDSVRKIFKESKLIPLLQKITLLRDKIIFAGWISEVGEIINYYRACEVFVLPAVGKEGFGKVVIEANAVGKPVVANKIGGIPDAIQHGENGFLIEPGNWNIFSDRIISIFEDENLRSYMQMKAMDIVKERFDWSIITRKYYDLFFKISQSRMDD